MCDVTQSNVSCELFTCVTWLIHTCDVTHSRHSNLHISSCSRYTCTHTPHGQKRTHSSEYIFCKIYSPFITDGAVTRHTNAHALYLSHLHISIGSKYTWFEIYIHTLTHTHTHTSNPSLSHTQHMHYTPTHTYTRARAHMHSCIMYSPWLPRMSSWLIYMCSSWLIYMCSSRLIYMKSVTLSAFVSPWIY